MSIVSKVNSKWMRTFFLRFVISTIFSLHVAGMLLHYFNGQAIDHVLFQTNAQMFYWILFGTAVGAAASIPQIQSFMGRVVGKIRGKHNGKQEAEATSDEATSNEAIPFSAQKGQNVAFSIAKKYLGLKEIEGDKHNAKIIQWIDME